jgi:hypothetical protein
MNVQTITKDVALFEFDFTVEHPDGDYENNGWMVYAINITRAIEIVQYAMRKELADRWRITNIRVHDHSNTLLDSDVFLHDNEE